MSDIVNQTHNQLVQRLFSNINPMCDIQREQKIMD